MTHLKGTQETGDHTTFDLSKVLKSTIVGSDAVGVFDSSDPLDIVCQIFINKTGTGVDVVADTEELDDSMPDGAYLKYVPTLVVRGETASAGPTTWLKGRLTDPAGIDIPADLTPDATTGAYKLYVSEMKGYYGQHTLTMSGMLTG